jgi:hypothetical protein
MSEPRDFALHTVVVYLCEDTQYRVAVDGLEGSEAEAIDSARHVLAQVAQNPGRQICRVVRTDLVTDL